MAVGLGLALAACAPAPAAPPPMASAPPSAAPTGDVMAEASAAIADQAKALDRWAGPTTGVHKAKPDAEIDYVAADETNGGVMAVYEGLKEAAAAMGWSQPVLRDGIGSPEGRAGALQAAVAAKPAAIVLGGFDPSEQTEIVASALAQGIVVVGWHAGPVPGPSADKRLFTNITTPASEVALLAADFVIQDSHGTAGVAIFTDSEYQIALDKANIMRTQIERCGGCQVLAYRDLPIADSNPGMLSAVRDLRRRFGAQLTYLLAINGNYFGGSRQALALDGVGPTSPPWAVAAGDGDQAEFDRIRSQQYQLASVAEPLYLQGWQIVDEINRALAGDGPSDFVAGPGLIKLDSVPAPGKVWDPSSGYRERYRQLWDVGS